MPSWLTRQRIRAAQIRVIDLQREVPLLLGWSLAYIILSGSTAQLIRHWPLPVLGSTDFLLDYWYILCFKIFGLPFCRCSSTGSSVITSAILRRKA
jgi:hypothetical protein